MTEKIVGKAFNIKDHQIQVLDSPSSFKNSLNSILLNAKNRIYISSLYTDDRNEITNSLINLAEKSSTNDRLKIKLILDYNRMTRRSENDNPVINALRKFPNSTEIQLCKIPTVNYSSHFMGRATWTLIKILSKFRKTSFLKEVLGVYHIKIFLADNNIIISSANLNTEYLQNKQDRYIMITDAKEVCDYFERALNLISEYSHKILPNGEILPPKNSQFSELKKDLMEISDSNLQDQITSRIKLKLKGTDTSDDCMIAPYFQCPPINIKSEEAIITNISQFCDKKNTDLFLITPYLNLPSYFVSLLKDFERPINVVSGVPVTKCSKSAKMRKRPHLERIRTIILPRLYSHINYLFLEQFGTQGKGNINYYEYKRPGWSFHFKGLYFFRNLNRHKDTETNQQAQGSIMATTFGSSNYNHRSINKDFECSFLLVPNQNKDLEKSLKSELENIKKNSVRIYAPRITLRRSLITRIIRILQEYL